MKARDLFACCVITGLIINMGEKKKKATRAGLEQTFKMFFSYTIKIFA